MTKINPAQEISFQIVDVTPALAAEWLTRNFENNRTINASAVARFAEDMKSGAWRLTHQGLAFDEIGRLVDGQHRLRAVLVANVSARMVVSYYLAASPLEKIDRGTARSIGAVLEVSGAFPRGHGKAVAAAINAIACLVSGSTAKKVTVEKMREAYEAHRAGVDFASPLLRCGKITAPFAAAIAYAYPICPQRIESMAAQVINNDGLSMHSGAWHLRRLMDLADSQARDQRLEASRAAVKCAMLHVQDREVKLFKVGVEGSFDGMEWAARERAKLGLCTGLTS